jgi:putative hydrolase of the HAD superfamily
MSEGRGMKALLVDLDDTLLDYTGGVDESWLEACSAMAAPAGLDPIALGTAIARARRWLWSDPARHRMERTDMPGAWRKIAARALADVGAPGERLATAIAGDYAERRWKRMGLFPGVPDALHRLRRRGVSLALVTNGDRRQQRRKVEQYDLARFFDVILIEGEFGAGKPEAAVYRHVLAALGVAPAEAWMVGDNLEWDVAAPQRLGLRGVWVDARGGGPPEPAVVRPDLVIRAFVEILHAVPGGDDRTATPREPLSSGELAG